jgi:hypothetical protein
MRLQHIVFECAYVADMIHYGQVIQIDYRAFESIGIERCWVMVCISENESQGGGPLKKLNVFAVAKFLWHRCTLSGKFLCEIICYSPFGE